jgi:hypothetical protein
MNKIVAQIFNVVPPDALNAIFEANGTSLANLVQNAKIKMDQDQKEAESISTKASEIKERAEQEYLQIVDNAKVKLQGEMKVVKNMESDAQGHLSRANEIGKALQFIES